LSASLSASLPFSPLPLGLLSVGGVAFVVMSVVVSPHPKKKIDMLATIKRATSKAIIRFVILKNPPNYAVKKGLGYYYVAYPK